MYLVIQHENPCEGLCEILKRYFDEKNFTCISIKNCCFPIESTVIAFAKAMKAFKRGENVAKRQDIETLVRLVGNRQIKTVVKLLNEINESACKSQAHYVTLIHVNAGVKTLENTATIASIREEVLQQIDTLGCFVTDATSADVLTKICCFSIMNYLFSYWNTSISCDKLILLGVSGSSDIFIS
ncbi:MAG: hypothetical protein QW370_00915 [Ignisphaera sp.]